MNQIRWGIIGCGDVTELKSGPAFNKVPRSSLVAVMRRDAEKAKDYALRHHVPKWYNDANQLINDAQINAIYIATPPSSHFEYAMAAMNAGKMVYLEKPMTLNYGEARILGETAKEKNAKLVVAHYRRQQPMFKKIKELLHDKIIGDVRFVNLLFYTTALTPAQMLTPKTAWRVDPSIAGGGLFHDLAPHQLDLLYYFFGEPKQVNGMAINQAGLYNADDLVTGHILFKNKVVFAGSWCFSAITEAEKDHCEMIGSKGKIEFSVFNGLEVKLTTAEGIQTFGFDKLMHVQQPMIEAAVNYFLGEGENPCTADEGSIVMRMIESFVEKIIL